jgi:hypothetical protein
MTEPQINSEECHMDMDMGQRHDYKLEFRRELDGVRCRTRGASRGRDNYFTGCAKLLFEFRTPSSRNDGVSILCYLSGLSAFCFVFLYFVTITFLGYN